MNSAGAVVACTVVVSVIGLFGGSALSADLCSPLDPPKKEGVYDRRMREATFGGRNVGGALRYFEQDLPRALAEKATTEEVRNSESYSIGYPNSS